MIFKLFFVMNPTQIFINLDKFNNYVIHSGITFKNTDTKIRYDFRAFNTNNSYITNADIRTNVYYMFPDLFIESSNNKNNKLNNINYINSIYNKIYNKISFYSKEIFWGESNFSIEELIEIEKNINKNYLLGVNDCRHYVNELCKIALNKEIPIWNLNSLIDH